MTWAAGPERTSCRSVLERGVGAKRCAALVASHRTARPTSLHGGATVAGVDNPHLADIPVGVDDALMGAW